MVSYFPEKWFPPVFFKYVIWFCISFNFVRSQAQCGCCSIGYLRFQVGQIKLVDCKMSTKTVNNYK